MTAREAWIAMLAAGQKLLAERAAFRERGSVELPVVVAETAVDATREVFTAALTRYGV